MPVVAPRAFISYSRRDSGVVMDLVDALRRAGVNCWLDTLRLQVGDEWNRVIGQEVSESDLFFAYITNNYLKSKECRHELNLALQSPRLLVVPYADSAETRDALPSDLKSKINCGILGSTGSEQYHNATLELTGRAWASLQVVERVVTSSDHILASPTIFDMPGYTRTDILRRTNSELVLAGPNLRSWLSDEESKLGLVDLVQVQKKRLRLILATYESLAGVSEEGAIHLQQSVEDILSMIDLFNNDAERDRFTAHFHVGASTLSAVFVDPMRRDGILFFSPRWAIQFLPQDRFSCVIDKAINGEDLYKSLYNSVLLMTQRDAKTVHQMRARPDIVVSYPA